MIGELANHLWQSTAWAAAATLLAAAFRHHQARVRYWIWLSASMKFLIPFTLLIDLGARLEWAPAVRAVAPAMTVVVAQATEPFTDDLAMLLPAGVEAAPAVANVGFLIFAMWLVGVLALAVMRVRTWRQIRCAVDGSVPLQLAGVVLPQGLQVRAAHGVMEPGVVGWWRPVLLVPEGIEEHLTVPQLQAVIAHELAHVQHRDNFASALHMLVEGIFWFYPLVWWIGARLVDERERACDEHVLRVHGEPQAYAEGILNVCKRYVDAPLRCVSGVGGSNLRQRIEAIMHNRIGRALSTASSVVLLTVAGAAIALPVLAGALTSSGIQAYASAPAVTNRPSFAIASIRLNTSGEPRGTSGVQPGGRFTATNQTLDMLIASAYQPLQRLEVTGIPDWARTTRYDVEARADGDAPPQQVWLMLQSLLADRFNLVARREQREVPVYELVAIREGQMGPQLRLHTDDRGCVQDAAAAAQSTVGPRGMDASRPLPPPPCGAWSGTPVLGRLAGQGVTLDTFARAISGQLRRMVIDRTGLAGPFDLTLDWAAPPLAGPNAPPAPVNQDGPTIFAALQEQLGLRLVPQMGRVNMLVVESVEKPSDN